MVLGKACIIRIDQEFTSFYWNQYMHIPIVARIHSVVLKNSVCLYLLAPLLRVH